mmetsp:Transcript_62802/g.151530  ORF Transcript_62802/g.151530 Transcript_62802/m.151530 type:complete len:235 (-) Transcript_62802:282-986(-)
MSGVTEGERTEGESGVRGESGPASASVPPDSARGLSAEESSQSAGEISPGALLARVSARQSVRSLAAAGAVERTPTAVTRSAMRVALASLCLLASLVLTRSARCSMRMPTVSDITTATQKAYMASRPRMRRSMPTWPPESSSGERTWAEAIFSRWSQSTVQLRRGAMLELSQYFRHSLLSVASNSPHSCCSGMLSGMLKRAMMTHMTMTSVSDHFPPKASQKLTLRRHDSVTLT